MVGRDGREELHMDGDICVSGDLVVPSLKGPVFITPISDIVKEEEKTYNEPDEESITTKGWACVGVFVDMDICFVLTKFSLIVLE